MIITESQQRFREEGKVRWQTIHQELFGSEVPTEKTWHVPMDILWVLNTICNIQHSCITYLPGEGQLDLQGAEKSKEPGCIELQFTTPAIVKPEQLIFKSFESNDIRWNYFTLRCYPMNRLIKPTDDYTFDLPYGFYEDVSEEATVKYTEPTSVVLIDEQAATASLSERKVNRYFRGGDFVLFANGSPYHRDREADSGQHQKLGVEAFRRHIEVLISKTP